MPNVTLTGNALSTGPSSTNYAGAVTGVYGKTAEVLWKEGSYYYVRLTNPRVEGYIATSFASLPSGTSVSTFTPSQNQARYVGQSSTAYLGQGTSYSTIAAPNRAQMVNYLGKKTNGLAYIEYELANHPLKYRAWFSESALGTKNASELTASQYLNAITVAVSPYEDRFQDYYDSEGNHITFCNHYAYYAMQACGTPLPARASDGAPAICGEMLTRLSNGYRKWEVITNTNAYEEAQARANNGYPTIALEESHVAVVRPNSDGSIPSSKSQVRISQAGNSIFDNGMLSQGWSVNSSEYNAIQFFSWYY